MDLEQSYCFPWFQSDGQTWVKQSRPGLVLEAILLDKEND
jgi:hypothetical protein